MFAVFWCRTGNALLLDADTETCQQRLSIVLCTITECGHEEMHGKARIPHRKRFPFGVVLF